MPGMYLVMMKDSERMYRERCTGSTKDQRRGLKTYSTDTQVLYSLNGTALVTCKVCRISNKKMSFTETLQAHTNLVKINIQVTSLLCA